MHLMVKPSSTHVFFKGLGDPLPKLPKDLGEQPTDAFGGGGHLAAVEVVFVFQREVRLLRPLLRANLHGKARELGHRSPWRGCGEGQGERGVCLGFGIEVQEGEAAKKPRSSRAEWQGGMRQMGHGCMASLQKHACIS
ncbi:hypothetical protein GUJ93_ZPchr0010g10999 [Zizania palustris]|uniref:Uncharacterized protein n=1 Tax=Zizania palustris TaxID=103762 RepID=A0A8J6BIX7_ZIZPA|nr:hypothetical protein GUJ93_ZPchr0010g10999 [Zizania palustris]